MTDTIQNALDVLRLMQSLYECDLIETAPEWSHSLRQAVTDLEALTQRPAAQTERDTGPRVLREVFALCEDTIDKMAGVNTEFSRGRAFEAKGISRAIGTWFQDEYCGQSHMGEPSLPAPQQATSERHLTVTTNQQGEAVMVSWQDDEHRILEVVWERKQVTPKPCKHVLYKTEDADKPREICDRNGEVVLAMCRICGKAEAELVEITTGQPATPASDARELAYNMAQWREDARTHGSEHVPVHVTTIDKLVKHLRSIPPQQDTPEPSPSYAAQAHAQIEHLLNDLVVEDVCGSLKFYSVRRTLLTNNLIDALKRLHAQYPTATPEPVGEVVAWWYGAHPRPSIETIRLDHTFTDHAGEYIKGRPLVFGDTRPAPGVPEGFALVPVEPEREMMEAMPSLPAIGAPGDMELKAKGWSLKAIQNRHRWLAAIAAAQVKGGK